MELKKGLRTHKVVPALTPAPEAWHEGVWAGKAVCVPQGGVLMLTMGDAVLGGPSATATLSGGLDKRNRTFITETCFSYKKQQFYCSLSVSPRLKFPASATPASAMPWVAASGFYPP